MPLRTTAAALAVVALSAGLIAGCSQSSNQSNKPTSTSTSATPLPDAPTLLKQASDTTRNYQSVHLELKVDEGLRDRLPIETLSGDLTNSPTVAAKGTTTVFILGQRANDLNFVVYDGTLYAPLVKGGKLQNLGDAKDIYDVSLILNPDTGLANVLANFTAPKEGGNLNIDGVDTVEVTGTVDADTVNKIAPQLAATGPTPATAWIRVDGKHELVRAKLEVTPGSSVEMTMTDWGKTVTVDKPAS